MGLNKENLRYGARTEDRAEQDGTERGDLGLDYQGVEQVEIGLA